jgi:hypothetical protein
MVAPAATPTASAIGVPTDNARRGGASQAMFDCLGCGRRQAPASIGSRSPQYSQ